MRAWNVLGPIRIVMVMFLFCALADCSDGATSAGPDGGTSGGPSCSDGIKNGTETDVDCGGPSCGGCAVTKACAMDTDCASVACDANLCVVAPAVVSVAPPQGAVGGGTAIAITGVSFVAGATVKINGVDAANVAVVSGTQITAKTPASATTGAVNVVVTNPNNRMATGIKLFTYFYTNFAFDEATSFAAGTQPLSVAVGDFNGDNSLAGRLIVARLRRPLETKLAA